MKTIKEYAKKPTTRSDRNVRILNFLSDRQVGVLATVDPNGDPHAAAIYFAVDPSFNIRFLTKRRTKKSDNLQHHNHAVLVVFDEESQTTVQIKGKAREITDLDEAHQVFRSTLRASLHMSENGIPPVAKLSAGDYIAYILKPGQVRMAVYARSDTGGYEQMFEEADLTAR